MRRQDIRELARNGRGLARGRKVRVSHREGAHGPAGDPQRHQHLVALVSGEREPFSLVSQQFSPLEGTDWDAWQIRERAGGVRVEGNDLALASAEVRDK